MQAPACEPARLLRRRAAVGGVATSPAHDEAARITTGKHLIFRLILPNFLPNSVKLVTSPQSRFFSLGDALRDRPATPEAETFVPNSRRHGGAAAISKKR